jgi:outer membrane lipoprotein-sorting protein
MDADDKGAKKTAREMMHMQAEINKASFRGQKQVTCYSCHRGSQRPVNTPPVLESDAPARPAAAPMAPPAQGQTVTADQILEKYVAALGGPDAIRKITSRVQTGKILAGGSETPIEVLTKAPNKRVTITHAAAGDSFTAFDGTAGWMGNAGRPAREMSPAESMASGLDAEFALALRIKEIFPQLRRGRLPVRLYFDAKTGLLVRLVRYADTPLGRNPTQIDYADYRDQDGVKTPFRWTLSRPNGRFTIQIANLKTNVPIDDSKFAKP